MMPVRLSVSQVRAELSRARGWSDDPPGTSSAALGTLFHQVMRELLDDGPSQLSVVLREQDVRLEAWKRALRAHAYDAIFGPLLTRQAASLANRGAAVHGAWAGAAQACDWLCEVWWEITRGGTVDADPKDWFSAEVPVSWEVCLPEWRESVIVSGVCDAVLRRPPQRGWCVLEWKLGRADPEVDLAQACLYHILLGSERTLDDDVPTAVAVMTFRPERVETFCTDAQLAEGRRELVRLIGRLAAVTRDDGPPSPPPGLAQWLVDTSAKLLRVLRDFGARAREARPPVLGPTFARFYVLPEPGVRNTRVTSQADQLHLHLSLPAPPTMSVVDGAIAIDIARPAREALPFSVVRPVLPARDPLRGNARVPVGMDLDRKWIWCDLAASESAHLLVVGSPGSGKSQWLRVALATLLATNTPETLQLVLIDPKGNAFGFARRRPEMLRGGGILGLEGVIETLEAQTTEMVARNALLAEKDVQSLAEYSALTGIAVPRVVVLCDEYADLLAAATKAERVAIEHHLKRLAQVGRAPGFHLVLATQQPRSTVINTSIRALLPAKVALRVADKHESRVAMDEPGAENLLGQGDLWFKCIGPGRRLQGAWLPPDEEQLAAPWGTGEREP